VIEHIEDDIDAIRHLTDMLAPNGYLVVTVPAFQILWDEHDEINEHYRRYRARDMRRLLAPHGRLERLRYLFPSLFMPKLAVALLNRVRQSRVTQASMPSRLTTQIAARWLRAEDRLTAALPIPVGTSVLAVMRKAGVGS
jgi:hypothetical protein